MFKQKFGTLVFLVWLFPFYAYAQNFGGNPSSIHWKQINNSGARVIFPTGLDSQANRIHNIVEMLDTTTAQTIGGNHRKWNIILQNQTTVADAYVRMAPIMSELYMIPAQDNFANGSIRWDDNLIIHEDRHMQQLSNFNKGFTKVFSFFLGQEGQLLANGLVIPNYFFEGDAVWQETLVSAQGRGRTANFFNDYKSLWLANKNYSWMKLRSGSYKNFTPDHYRLGYMLLAYGNVTYGEDFWRKVTNDAVRFKGLFYPFNRAIERYSGKTYKQFRNDAFDYFKTRSLGSDQAKTEQLNYITVIQKNNVIDYQFPVYITDDSILVAKRSYRSLNAFYLIVHGKEKKIRVKNTVLDDYYSYSHGKIVYASFESDPRWANRDYSVLQVIDIKTHQQKQLSFRSYYFSPDLNDDASEILAVKVNPNGNNNLCRLNANTGTVILEVSNGNNYFFTQTKYLSSNEAVSAVRDPSGKMALVKINLTTGKTENITPFTFNLIGYPFIKGDEIYFSAMNGNADKVFMVNMATKKISRVTNNINGVYAPVINTKGEMLVSAFTADGSRLAKINVAQSSMQEIPATAFTAVTDPYTAATLQKKGAGALYNLKEEKEPVTKYRKSFHLFNFHSRRPVAADPEYGYSFYNDDVLSSFSNVLTYTYNRNEKSHGFDISTAYTGWFPVLSLDIETKFNRNITATEVVSDSLVSKPVIFNSAKINAGVSFPLSFVGGRTNKYLNFGASYNLEQFYFQGTGKNIFTNESLHYANAFLSFSNVSGQAKQHVNPRWAQSISAGYRYAFNVRDSRKFVGSTDLYFPGLFSNHSFLVQGAFQKRDSLPDIFSNTFSYSRGYLSLSTRRMFKVAANYQLPILYPDLGVGNIIFFQRVRANAFYDYTDAYARLNGALTNIINRSTGAELFFDTKLWNALPFSFEVRYSHLLDTDLRNSKATGRWEFIIFNFVPD